MKVYLGIVVVIGLFCCCCPTGPDDGPNDTTPPAKITDLSATLVTASRVHLNWTAPGDDDTTGQASYYQLRYATYPLTPSNWDSASAPDVHGGLGTSPAGQTDSVKIQHLKSDITYCFALVAVDRAGNRSPISNLCQVTTLEQPYLEYEGTYYRSSARLNRLMKVSNSHLIVEYTNYWGMLPNPALFAIDLTVPIQSNSGVHFHFSSPASVAYGDRLFVACYPTGYWDLSEPPQLSVCGLPPDYTPLGDCILADSAHSRPRPNSMATNGDYVFIACGDVAVVDVRVSSSPLLLGFHSSLPTYLNSLRLIDSTLIGCEATFSNTVVLANIANPNDIAVAHVYEATATVNDISLCDNLMCLLLANQRIQIVNISSPETPNLASEIVLNQPVADMSAANGFLYTVDSLSGVQMYSLQDPSSPTLLTSYDIAPLGAYVYAEDSDLFVAERDQYDYHIVLNVLHLKSPRN